MNNQITVIKRDHRGRTVWRYKGTVLDRGNHHICIEAHFHGRAVVDIGVMAFHKGDLMREWFYSDRYYNVFQVHEGASGPIKGWYCNITRPAQITSDSVSADDLALDIYVGLDGSVTVLDEDEFRKLNLPPHEQQAAQAAVAAIRTAVAARETPFNAIR